MVKNGHCCSTQIQNTREQSPNQATGGDDAGDLPQMWGKISDKILKHMNDRFDKLEMTLQTVQSSQKELIDKVETI